MIYEKSKRKTTPQKNWKKNVHNKQKKNDNIQLENLIGAI